MVYVFTRISFNILRKRTLTLSATIEGTLTTVLYYVVDDILCRASSQYPEEHYPLSIKQYTIKTQGLCWDNRLLLLVFWRKLEVPINLTYLLRTHEVLPYPHIDPLLRWRGSPGRCKPPPPSLIGHHRAAGRWLQDGSYLYLFWKPRWRAGSAQVWPPRGAAGARNMGPRTPLTPLRKLWPSSLEYSCESTCE